METEKEKKASGKRRRGLWWKVPLWTLLTVILLVVAGVSVTLWLLTPERLTAMVRKYGTECLDGGRVDVSRVELTWWSSFPRFELTVDSLAVRCLRDQVPDSASTLLSVERLHGAINVAALMQGAITVHDVSITRPSVFVYVGADGHGNLDVLPQSTDTVSEPSSDALILPPIELERFVIEGDAPLRYLSVPDSIDAAVTVRNLSVISGDNPVYALDFSAMPRTNLVALPDSFAVGLNGTVAWSPEQPLEVAVSDFTVSAGEVAATFDAAVSLADPLTVRSLNFRMEDLDPNYLLSLAAMQPQLGASLLTMEVGGRLNLHAELTTPYSLADTLLPAVNASVELTEGPLAVPEMRMRFREASLAADVSLRPECLDSSVVNLRHLELTGQRGATSVALNATATSLLSDPHVKGHFKGNIILGQLPPRLLKALGVKMAGRLNADTDFNLRLSDMSANTFHRARLSGRATLTDLEASVPADSILASVGKAELRFGTSRSFVGDSGRIDSMLTVSVSVDTASVSLPEMTAQLSKLKLGFGCRNDASRADTSVITPMGGRIELDRLRFRSTTDSTRAILRGLDANARLLRFKGDKKVPQFGLDMDVRRIVYAQGLNRVSLSKSKITADMHVKPRKKRTFTAADSARMRSRRDSLAAAAPMTDDMETLDFGLDTKTASLLRRLELDGHLSASRGRVFTPLFPLRMSMRDLDFHFTADSLNLNSLELTAGESRLHADGSVTNIRRSVAGFGRRKSPLKIGFNLHADTLNINELTQAAFRGAALAAQTDSAAMQLVGSVDLDDDAMQSKVDSMAVTDIAAVLVPVNIDAALRFTADNIIYSNMMMHDFTGSLLINRGAISLQGLHALTDIGSVDLNALYYAPSKHDIDLAMALRLNRFRIDRVIDLMPALDTIMPILGQIGGVIDVTLGTTAQLDSAMNLKTPTLHAMMNMTGDSLVVIDESTFKTIAKWLMFKNKQRNMIEHMSVELSVENSMLELYPFMFDFDRYRLGVMGHNDLDLNLNYHVSVLKSPLPFKFGINITGPADDMKIRVGKARYKNKVAARSVALADSARINLVKEIRSAFSRGVEAARVAPLKVESHERIVSIDSAADTIPAEQMRQLEIPEK